MAFWQNQAHERECDKFHWIGGEGFFSVAELEAIAREVWISGEQESTENDDTNM